MENYNQYGDKIKENQYWNFVEYWLDHLLEQRVNAKDMNESVMKISAKMGNANSCYGKVYIQEEKDLDPAL